MKTEEFENKRAEMSNDELIERAEKEVCELAKTGGRSHRMCIPPMITDTDMILSELIRRFKTLMGATKLNDMSYSGIVDEIQGDKAKAIKLIIEIAKNQEDSINYINELQKKIDTIQSVINNRKQGLKHISDHIMHYPPFRIVEKDFIYFLNNDFSVQIKQADYLL